MTLPSPLLQHFRALGGGLPMGYVPINPLSDAGYSQYGSGRLFVPLAATNYAIHPSFELDAGAGLATGYSLTGGTSGVVTTLVAGYLGGLAQRLQWTGGAGVTNKALRIEETAYTANGSFAAGDKVEYSVWIKGSVTGAISIAPTIYWYKDDNTFVLTEQGPAFITPTSGWVCYSYVATAPATATKLRVIPIVITGLDEGDTVDVTIDKVMLCKGSIVTPYFDGASAGCSWAGTANASTSSRPASVGLYYPSPWTTVPASGTIAGRFIPLGANTQYTAEVLAALCNGTTPVAQLLHASGKPRANVTTTSTSTASFAALAQRIITMRWSPSDVRLNVNGVDATAGGAPTTGGAIDSILAGGLAGYWAGPLVFSAENKTDAWVTAMNASSGAAWALDAAALRNGYLNDGDVLIPFSTDAVGQRKVSGNAPFDWSGQLIVDGCSLAQGVFAPLVTALANPWTATDVAVGGQTTAQMNTDAATEVDPMLRAYYQRHVVVAWELTNDLGSGTSAADAYAHMVTYCQGRQAAGYKVVVVTCLPRGSDGTFETKRLAVNASIRAGWATFADALADPNTDPHIGYPGAQNDATYYYDTTHCTAAGYAIAAGYLKAAIESLP